MTQADGACKSGEDWVGAVVAGSSSGLCASGAGACLGRLIGVAAAALPEQARSAQRPVARDWRSGNDARHLLTNLEENSILAPATA